MRHSLSVLLFLVTTFASENGFCTASRKIPRNAAITNEKEVAPPILASVAPESAFSMREVIREPRSQDNAWTITVGPGLVFYQSRFSSDTNSGVAGLSINSGVVTKLKPASPLFVGIDAALNFWSFDTNTKLRSMDAVGVQVLPTAYYRFEMPWDLALRPYFGVSAGPHLYVNRTAFITENNSTSATTLYLELLFRPGIEAGINSEMAFAFEPKFGMLGTTFIFNPVITAMLTL